MKPLHFDVETSGFYGAYWPCADDSSCAVVAMIGDDPEDRLARSAAKWLYAHGTHFVFPEGMLKIMLPVGSGLFVKLAFQAAKKYSKECSQTRKDIEKRMNRTLAEWKGAK